VLVDGAVILRAYLQFSKASGKRTVTPMDYFSNAYFALKNNVIKAERRVLKELGFCVHVKHPHKVIITYLQILEHERNTALAQKAWNYMNDSLRTDVFLRFAPEKIGCACIFLAARVLKVVLPQKPPWWELFDTSSVEIDDIALTIVRLYARPKVKMTRLDAAIENAKKLLQDKKDAIKENGGQEGTPDAFTPSHVSPNVATGSSISTKISSKTNSPVETPLTSKSNETKKSKDPIEIKKPVKRSKNEDGYRRSRSITPSRRKNARPDSGSSYDESESDSSSPDRKRNTKKDRRARNDYSSDDSDADSHRIKAKDRRNDSEGRPKSRLDKENGHRLYNYEKRQKGRSRSRSRSRSRDRRDKNRDKRREKKRDEKSRYNERENRINYDRYDKKGQR